ncbi:MAG: phage tail protein [Microthrixaceae bacterium]|nr:phage tail protein [Actinomycetota bacterium]MBP6728022.1 phage tail protein [Microthrixaceae bacterium]HMS15011.1 phage tail protein [Microthrixaceae bacterium]HMT25726.1 phage tail protein [Microthrixaceae bacterium]HMT60079.1 phage tail protein [Microthrixaceae bacterium]
MPQVGDIWESYRANEFVLIIEGRVSPSVTKVSGLSEGEVETIEQPVGGSMLVHKIAGAKVKYEPLTIERYVDGSADDSLFADWFRSVFSLNSATQGGSGLRRNGMIEKRHNGVPVISFAFYGAWIKSSKFTDLEAGSTGLFKQTIVLEHEGLERVV